MVLIDDIAIFSWLSRLVAIFDCGWESRRTNRRSTSGLESLMRSSLVVNVFGQDRILHGERCW